MRVHLSLLTVVLATGCGRATTNTGYKLAGVGANPDEIDPSPTDYSGIISYDWIEFSGAALPLGLVGLVSFEGVTAASAQVEPPYAVVYASGLVMDGNLPATDALFGNFGVAPEVEGRCHTIYEPASYVSGLADVGTAITIENEDGSQGIDIGRRPLAYPPDVQDVFPTYLGLEAWRQTDRTYFLAPDGEDQELDGMEQAILNRANYPFGQQTHVSFPGALPPDTATFSSIPVPSGVEDISHVLPTRPVGVMMTWDGPQYSSDGIQVGSGEISTCFQYQAHGATPSSPADCVSYEALPDVRVPVEQGDFPRGQMYTAPWETDGGITFQWVTSEDDVDETVSITVRLLGELEEEDDNLVEAVVEVPVTSDARRAWEAAQEDGDIPSGAEIGTGRRDARVCEDDSDVEYLFDDIYQQGDEYVPSLQGSPFRNMAEVVCNVGDAPTETITGDDGVEYNIASFTLTTALLRDAMTYGEQQGAKGAVFYFNRTTKTPLDLPPVRDYQGNRRTTGDVLVVSNAAQLGRFWLGEGL